MSRCSPSHRSVAAGRGHGDPSEADDGGDVEQDEVPDAEGFSELCHLGWDYGEGMDRGDGRRSVLTLRYAIITFSPANIAQQSTRAEVRVERCLTVQALDHWKLKFAQLDQPPQP